MKISKKLLICILTVTLIFSMASTISFAGNTQDNGWGVASWYCEKSTSGQGIDYSAIRAEVISQCNKDWGVSSQSEWNNEQYEMYLNRMDEAIEKAKTEYETENASYDLVAAFSMPEDPSYLNNYIPNCKPYVYVEIDGQPYSRVPLTLMSDTSEYAVANVAIHGHGEFTAMICHNGIDGVPTAQSADYSSFSTATITTYAGGMKCKYTNKMNESFARIILDEYYNIAESKEFTDVDENKWYYDDVMLAVQNDLIEGKTHTLFYPEDNMTYAEAITLAARTNILFKGKDPYLYFDSSYIPWYQDYLNYVRANGIPCNFKDLNASISREDFVHIFYSAIPGSELKAINKVSDGAIPDVSMEDDYANEIYAFYRSGILGGSDDARNFYPDSSIKRSEVATILSRIIGNNRQEFTL